MFFFMNLTQFFVPFRISSFVYAIFCFLSFESITFRFLPWKPIQVQRANVRFLKLCSEKVVFIIKGKEIQYHPEHIIKIQYTKSQGNVNK